MNIILTPTLKKWLRVFYFVCAVLFLGDLIYFFIDDEGHGFGFYSLYGLISCVVLVVLAKGLRRILMRKEDYYND